MSDPNKYQKQSNGLESPALSAEAISPSDGADLPNTSRAIYVGGNGNITVNLAGTGDTILFSNVVAGTFLPIRVERVLNTGTTAANLVALF